MEEESGEDLYCRVGGEASAVSSCMRGVLPLIWEEWAKSACSDSAKSRELSVPNPGVPSPGVRPQVFPPRALTT